MKRNPSLDIIRILAFLSVVTVHYILNCGYYAESIQGITMIGMTAIRQLLMCCVPLFLLLSGYLYGTKEIEFNGKWLFKLLKTLIPFAVITVLTYFYNRHHLQSTVKLPTMLFGFAENGYSWYIEMYIELFLLIPFINRAYNGLKDKKSKAVFVLVVSVLSFIPSVINIRHDYSVNFWTTIYPIAYYLIGTYLRDFGLPFGKLSAIGIILLSNGAVTVITMLNSEFGPLRWGEYNDYQSVFTAITATMIFLFFIKIKADNLPKLPRTLLAAASDAVLPMYLLSYMTDHYFYANILPEITNDFKTKIYLAPAVTTGYLLILSAFGLLLFAFKKIPCKSKKQSSL